MGAEQITGVMYAQYLIVIRMHTSTAHVRVYTCVHAHTHIYLYTYEHLHLCIAQEKHDMEKHTARSNVM